MADNPQPKYKFILKNQLVLCLWFTLSSGEVSKALYSSSVQPKVARRERVHLNFLDRNGKPINSPCQPFSSISYLIMCSTRLACLNRT